MRAGNRKLPTLSDLGTTFQRRVSIGKIKKRTRINSNSADGDIASQSEMRIRVLRWGPYPYQARMFGRGIGGYARYNSQALRSPLAREVEILPLPMTVPRYQSPWLARAHLIPRMLKDMVVITLALLRYRPDVLHITSLYWRSIFREFWATMFAKALGIPVFFDIRAGTFEEFVSRSPRLIRALTKRILEMADEVAIQGRRAVQLIEELANRQANWLPNCFLGRDLEEFPPADLENFDGEGPLRLVFLGYLIPEKGVDILLEAAESLSQDIPVRVTLIGELSSRFKGTLEEYQQRQSDSFAIEAPGRLELDDVLRTLNKQHIFVFLSRFFGEGHPNAVNEAMAMGLPVIASRNGFLEDIVTNDCGVIVEDPEDAIMVRDTIRTLYQDWNKLVQMGKSARERILTVFSSEIVLKTTAAIYRRCAERKRW